MTEPDQQAAFLNRRLTSNKVNLKDSRNDQKAFGAALFPVCPPQFKDRVGIYFPDQVYQSYFAAIWEELWAFEPRKHMIRTVDDLMSVISIVQEYFTCTRRELLAQVTTWADTNNKETEPAKITASLEFAVNVWLLADFQTDPSRHADRPLRPWDPEESLCQTIQATIQDNNDDEPETPMHRRFSPRFTLYDMARLSLIEIEWTNNIAMHLYLEEWRDRRYIHTVYIFSHATLLQTIRQNAKNSSGVNTAPASSRASRVIPSGSLPLHPADSSAGVSNPPGSHGNTGQSSNTAGGPSTRPSTSTGEGDLAALMKETMDTLDLLLALDDPECQAWYNRLRKQSNKQRRGEDRPTEALDGRAGDPSREESLARCNVSELRRVGHYKIWRQRLLRLEEAFKESKPRKMRGWWHDKRNRGIWATFVSACVAILIAVIAVVVALGSIVTGGMSVDLAKKANHMALKDLQQDSRAYSSNGDTANTPGVVTVQACCRCD